MQAKVFTVASLQGPSLEELLNDWLKNEGDVSIVTICQSSSSVGTTDFQLTETTCTVLYTKGGAV